MEREKQTGKMDGDKPITLSLSVISFSHNKILQNSLDYFAGSYWIILLRFMKRGKMECGRLKENVGEFGRRCRTQETVEQCGKLWEFVRASEGNIYFGYKKLS